MRMQLSAISKLICSRLMRDAFVSFVSSQNHPGRCKKYGQVLPDSVADYDIIAINSVPTRIGKHFETQIFVSIVFDVGIV